jgi:flavin-dependent thymidylate synthase
MKVSLLDYTGNGQPNPAKFAAAILCYTKNTRLEMSPSQLNSFLAKSMMELESELKYMANTVPSSWEFVDYTFIIEGVTRAFTHQLVRTRTASYAQQTMRVLNVSQGKGWDYATGPTIEGNAMLGAEYDLAMDYISQTYKKLISGGAAIEDARGILPTNILTNIVMKINMRALVELCRKRSSPRVQGEYRSVLEQLKLRVQEVHPWIDIFLNRTKDVAGQELDDWVAGLKESGTIDQNERVRITKLIDLMRTQ